MTGGEVPATGTGAGFRVAAVRVPVALASLAVREVPEAGLALTAGPAVSVGTALAATGLDVAEVVEGAYAVAVAGDASLRSESVRTRRATVATSAHNVRLAGTHPAVVLAEETARTRRIALAD